MTTVSAEQVRAAVADLQEYSIEALSRLVAASSLSGQEQPAMAVAEELMVELGLAVEHIALNQDALKNDPLYSPAMYPDDDRFNLLAVHGSGDHERSLLFNGHLDVVPTGPEHMWRQSPYSPYVEGGWLFGRGSGDMKGGIICALAALKALRNLGFEPDAPVGFNWVLEEECTGNGALASVAELKRRAAITGHSPFAAVLIPEPLGENLISAQVGVYWMEVTLTGRPSHAAYMTTGLNPIQAGFALMQELKKLEHQWNLPENRHHAYHCHEHPINFNLGRIEGGEWSSSVPCTCTMNIRIGVYPEVDMADAKHEIEQYLSAAVARINPELGIDVAYHGFHAPGCTFDLSHPMFEVLSAAHQDIHGEEIKTVATTATTDARHFHLMLKTPVTCYGPEARNIHGIDESVSVESMQRVTAVFALFIAQWCGLKPRA